MRGRFFHLDALANSHQPGLSPHQLWEGLEKDLLLQSGEEIAIPTTEFREQVGMLSGHITKPIMAWWEMYRRAWMQGLLGARGRRWASALDLGRL